MAVESWISPEETPVLAEAATAMIEDRLSRFSKPERDAYWASIRKCYNTPYNPPASKRSAKAASVEVSVIAISSVDLPPIEVQAAALASSALSGDSQAA
ncbi:hypothetical protein [Methylobacterium sp. WL9]|uniref:hypothetical protein n=1 Tax=Methylobacterium sp. WL9 TaxID=2603898 RepID=UPI0011CB2D16|nr:hypothetical protein [Methylobacterium sp. WL9]TXN20542.1 hypothetical protein FV217_17560 [Methylobacterium sp. WL9]